jgi:hypothetical protein
MPKTERLRRQWPEKSVIFLRVHTLDLSADKRYQYLSLSVVSCRLTLAVNCICVSFRVRCGRVVNGLECAVSHIKPVPASDVSRIGLGALRTTMTCARVFLL